MTLFFAALIPCIVSKAARSEEQGYRESIQVQFIAGGPDIPDELLKAHEEGRVVFFCGAGISYPAGLPGFRGLVDKIYNVTGTVRSPIEQESYDRGRFDATLDLLERRLPGQRLAVRRALAQTLVPKLRRQGATETHSALLRLARSRDGALRLVTTNFDRLFEVAANRSGQTFEAYSAPTLPIPKNSRWNGIVYLHGSLPKKIDDTALNRLVVTSGDFGLAYLIERWAARFVGELFRNYVVCFVGYSIEDPVLRYMMDALAADRMLGESSPQAWALGDYAPGQEDSKKKEWEAKGVVPILYEVPVKGVNHSALHETVRAWAATYRDGVLGKERIVVSHALARPSASTKQDDFVGRLLWALADPSGLPAKQFAEFNPVPTLDWLLGPFSEERYQHWDLPHFGVSPRSEADPKLRFSLVRRPAPYQLAPSMSLVGGGNTATQWDNVMFQLARWLTRHLNDPSLVIWLASKGGVLHDRFVWVIERELDRFVRLEREGRHSELDEIRGHAPSAVPSRIMRTLWRLLLTGRLKSPQHEFSIYHWKEMLKADGLTPTVRLELRNVLAPKVKVSNLLRWGEAPVANGEPTRVNQIVDCELVLSCDHPGTILNEFSDEDWETALPRLLEDLQQLLRDALDLMRELGEADDLSDRSIWDMRSISPHWQNRGMRDWVTLIELLRDSWLAVRRDEPRHASSIAQAWFEIGYPTFKRLALFAAAQDDCITAASWVGWLTEDSARWLWSGHTMREVLRLLVLQGRKLKQPELSKLEAAILAGPSRDSYRDDLEPGRWPALRDRAIWLRLAKLSSSAVTLGTDASQHLARLSSDYPQWKLAPNERDEFSMWSSGTGDPDYEESRQISIAPRSRRELRDWLRQPVFDRDSFHEDTWRDTCQQRFYHSLLALCDLSREGVWPIRRWEEALQVWSGQDLAVRSWRAAAPLVQTMPDEVLFELLHAVTWWLDASSKSIDRHEPLLLELCARIMSRPISADLDLDANPQPVTEAINHPVGHVTQALLNLWLGRRPSDSEGLPVDIEPFFTQLCDMRVDRFRHGRVLLGSRLIPLFRVDRAWTQQWLLPLFDWAASREEARGVWEGFLWSPRLHRPLLLALRQYFLDTVRHYDDLGDHAQQYATLLTYAALEASEVFTPEDLRVAFAELPQAGLQECAQALAQAVEGAGDQRSEYWRNRVQPFWHLAWPKSLDRATPSIAEYLARACLAAGSEFPVALDEIHDWLRPVEHPDYVVHRLQESGLCSRFPESALRLLSLIIDRQPWVPRDLGSCLASIVEVKPSLASDAHYQLLLGYSRGRSG